MECSDWNVNFMNIFSLKKESASSDVSELELIVSRDSFPAEDPILQDLIDRLLVESFRKKPDSGKSCSCKVWSFQNTPPGNEDNEFLLRALAAEEKQTFHGITTRLAGRYASLAGSHPGLLIFLNVRITPAKGMGGTFLCCFALDYKELSRYSKHESLMVLTPDSIDKNCKKAFIFPFFNGYELDTERVKIINAGKVDGGLADLLYVVPPQDTDQLLMQELYHAITDRHDADQYETYFQAPPNERELFGDDSFVAGPDLLSQDEVEHISRKSYQSSWDKYGKKPKVKIQIDEGCKFEGQLDKMGETFFFAKKGDEKFLIVKGEKFLTKSQLSAIEFLDVRDIEDVINGMPDENGESTSPLTEMIIAALAGDLRISKTEETLRTVLPAMQDYLAAKESFTFDEFTVEMGLPTDKALKLLGYLKQIKMIKNDGHSLQKWIAIKPDED